MRVDLTTSGLGQTKNAGTARTGRGTPASAASGASEDPADAGVATDRAQFSFDQTRIRSLVAQALAAPEVRQAKVSSLSQAVGGGQYKVDAGKVADAILSAYRGGTQ